MKDSDWNKVLLPLLAVFAIYLPLSYTFPSPGQQPPGQPQSPEMVQAPPTVAPTPKPGRGRVPGEAARLLCDYFGLEPDLGRKGKLNTQQKSEFENRRGDYCRIKSVLNSKPSKLQPTSAKYKIAYLIATVPDPKDTRLDREFDLVLEAIQLAIGSAEYTFDRYWLPWEKGQAGPPAKSLADPRTAQMATSCLRDPGVILFRGSKPEEKRISEEKRLLLLFLVGETPTSGIHADAFKNALNQIKELSSTEEPVTEKELRILGPTFSGSADSLAMHLNAWIHGSAQRPKIRIITGSVGSIGRDDFRKKIGAPKVALPDVTFHTTVVPTKQVNDEFWKYLEDSDQEIKPRGAGSPDRARIAVLSEVGTGKGQNVRRGLDLAPANLSLTYPLHISQLRIEAEKVPQRTDATKALEIKEPSLPLPMSEAGSPESKDIVPVFSSLEPAMMEQALRKILTAINREQIRYVRVSATDPKDHLFLVGKIHKHCPNAVIFMQGVDLLHLHSEHYFNYEGALVISSYPLLGLNQLWTHPFKGNQSRLQFSTATAQGIYNATLALLGKEELMLEYGSPFETYEDGDKRYPALWLSIVGKNDIWPVRILKPDCSLKESNTLPAPVKPPSSGDGSSSDRKRPTGWLGLSGKYLSPTGTVPLLLIGSICVVLSLLLLALRHCARIRGTWLGRVFGDEEFYCYRLDHRTYLMCCCASLLTVSLFISGVALLPGWIMWELKATDFQTGWNLYRPIFVWAVGIFLPTLIGFFCLAVSVVLWALNGLRHFRRRIWVLPEQGAVVEMIVFAIGGLVAVAMIVLAIGGLIGVFFWFGTPEKVFFFLRTTELTNGISILPPGLFVVLVVFLLSFIELRRLNLAEQMPYMRDPRQRPDEAQYFLRFDHELAKSFEGLTALEDRIKKTIIPSIFNMPGAKLVALLVTALFFINWGLLLRNFIPSVEGRWFDWFFKLAFFVVPLLLVLTLLRFIWLWVAARRLLRRLSWHPLISQYAAEHSKDRLFEQLPRVDLMTTPTYDALSFSVLQARSFYNELKLRWGQAVTGRIKQLVEGAEKKLSDALSSDAKGEWQKTLQNRHDTQAALAELSEQVTGLLEKSWRSADGAGPNAKWQDAGKFFLITHIVVFLQHILAQMQNLVRLVTVGLVLLLFAAIFYPFQPRGQLLLFSWVTILTSVAVMLFIFMDVSRNETLSRLSGTKPGRVNLTHDLVFRALINGLIPILVLLGAQFPEAVRQIISWLSVFEGKKS